MQKRKLFSLCLSGLCLTLWGGAVSGQQKPPKPPAAPNAPQSPVTAPTNPLLGNPSAPRVKPIFAYTLIPFETLQPSVQMTPDQSVKIKPLYDKLDADTAALRAAAKTPEERNALNDKIRAMQTEANKQINAILDQAQRKKADGLMFEMVEMLSVGVSPQMLRDMKLTPDQRVAILGIVADVQAKTKGIPPAERKAKFPPIIEAERARIPALLTPAQNAIFDKYDAQGRPKRAIPTPATPAPVAPPSSAPAPGGAAPEKKP